MGCHRVHQRASSRVLSGTTGVAAARLGRRWLLVDRNLALDLDLEIGLGWGPGDVLLGLASSGVHSNGFSLVRKLVEVNGWKLDRPALFDQDRLLIEALLEPTRIYVRSLLPIIREGRLEFVVVDEGTLRYRTYPAARARQRSLLNGDIIKLFKELRVTDSFLMKSKVREMLFRKPAPRS